LIKSAFLKGLFLTLCFLSAFFAFTAVSYAGDPIELYYNDKLLPSEVPSISRNNTLLAPLRQVSELFANFTYDMSSGVITLQKGTVALELKLDSFQARLNGKKYLLFGKPILTDGYVMVPLGFVCQAFGAKLQWQDGDDIAYITLAKPLETAISSMYAQEPIELYFNGSRLNSEPPVVNNDGSLLAPSWLILKYFDINNKDITLFDSPLTNDNDMIPLLPICKALGAELEWQEGDSKAYLTHINTELITVPATNMGLSQGKIYLPVLMYHHFSDNPKESSSVTVTPQKFENDLIALKEAGYTTMLPYELLEAYKGGYLPSKPMAVQCLGQEYRKAIMLFLIPTQTRF